MYKSLNLHMQRNMVTRVFNEEGHSWILLVSRVSATTWCNDVGVRKVDLYP